MTKSRQWATLTAVVCLAVLAAGWFLVIKPQRARAADLRTQTQGVASHSAELRSQVAQLQAQQKDLPSQQKLLSQIATKVPDNPALPALIRQLSAAADGAGVNLVSLAPGQPTVVSSPPSAAAASATASSASASSAPLAGIPLNIQVQGSYFNVVQFFSAVEALNRAMLVSGFTLSPAGGPSAAGGSAAAPAGGANALPPNTLTAQITAQVFESPQVAATGTTASSSTSTPASGH